jgi:glyoxylase-like metal-dependent hydrolase (beta-lactamase superfamily II)
VDAGFPGQAVLFREAIEKSGASLKQLNQVIFTHQDLDHVGGFPGLLEAARHPMEIIAHEAERPYLEGEQPPVKFNPERIAALPEEQRIPMLRIASSFPRIKVQRAVADGEQLQSVRLKKRRFRTILDNKATINIYKLAAYLLIISIKI